MCILICSREKPLAMYIFSKNKQTIDSLLYRTSSGGVCVNDTLMHLSRKFLAAPALVASFLSKVIVSTVRLCIGVNRFVFVVVLTQL